MHRLALWAVVAAALIGVASPGWGQSRVALVIGNSAYRHTQPLANPRNDAGDVNEALKKLGFQTVFGTDLDKRGMDDAFRRFARLARDADAALVYYAGHGMQFGGANYLMPIDAQLRDEADVPYELAKVDDVVADLSRAKNIRIVVLDACRDNPLAEKLRLSLPATRSAAMSRGFARLERAQGMITAFATQPGQTAADGVAGARNSPFTASFLKQIAAPDVEVATVFRRVALDVNAATQGKQLPEVSISLLGEFYFARSESGTVAARPSTSATPAASASDPVAEAWGVTKDTTSVAVLEDFIRQFGGTPYGSMARARLDELKTSRMAALPPPAAAVPPTPYATGGIYTDTYVSSSGDCEYVCSADGRCRSYFYDSGSKKCLLSSGAGGAAVAARVPATPVSSPSAAAEALGEFYTDTYVGSAGDCQYVCSNDGRCRSYDYDAGSKQCRLASGTLGTAVSRPVVTPGTVSGAFYADTFVGGVGDCEFVCKGDRRCGSFHYDAASKKCQLAERRTGASAALAPTARAVPTGPAPIQTKTPPSRDYTFVSGVADCEYVCRQTAGCSRYSFDAAAKKCFYNKK